MKVRDLAPNEIGICAQMVRHYWGTDAAERAIAQMVEMFPPLGFSHVRDRPHFLVAADDDGVHGFAGFRRSWVMDGAYELIWIAVQPGKENSGLGTWLTERRLVEIEERGGKFVTLMTQQVEFFEGFGFHAIDTLNGYKLMIKRLDADNVRI
jgi:GNAT superfamily N-acetyltransferase